MSETEISAFLPRVRHQPGKRFMRGMVALLRLKVSRRSARRSPHDNVALCQGENITSSSDLRMFGLSHRMFFSASFHAS